MVLALILLHNRTTEELKCWMRNEILLSISTVINKCE